MVEEQEVMELGNVVQDIHIVFYVKILQYGGTLGDG